MIVALTKFLRRIGLWQEKLVKWTAVVCGLFWVAIILVTTCRCVPINKTWEVYPDPGGKLCQSLLTHISANGMINRGLHYKYSVLFCYRVV